MNRLSYLLSLPNRWRHRRGFGVQSPWAFSFVRDALFDKSRFYLFDELGGTHSDEQLFRIIHWLRPKEIIAHTDSQVTKAYLIAPLKRKVKREEGCDVYYYDAAHLCQLEKDIQAACFTPASVIIADGTLIGNSNAWNGLLSTHSVTTAFELRDRAVALFDTARQRQTYTL